MQAVFTRKTKGFSRLYDRKFTPSYTTTQDGIACPGKCRSIARSDRRMPINLPIVFIRRVYCSSVCLVVQNG